MASQCVSSSMCRGFTCLFIHASGLALVLAFLSVYIFVHVSVSMPVLRTAGLHSFNLSRSLILDLCT